MLLGECVLVKHLDGAEIAFQSLTKMLLAFAFFAEEEHAAVPEAAADVADLTSDGLQVGQNP